MLSSDQGPMTPILECLHCWLRAPPKCSLLHWRSDTTFGFVLTHAAFLGHMWPQHIGQQQHRFRPATELAGELICRIR